MAAQIKVLIDLNVVLDALQKRHPFFGDSASEPIGQESFLGELNDPEYGGDELLTQ